MYYLPGYEVVALVEVVWHAELLVAAIKELLSVVLVLLIRGCKISSYWEKVYWANLQGQIIHKLDCTK